MNNSISLRQKAGAAWQQQEVKERRALERRISREPLALQEKLRAVCGDEYEIRVDTSGERVTAEVDGLLFVSTYNEPFRIAMPEDMAEQYAGVRLWWRCEKCGDHQQSEVIYQTHELGKQLENFTPEKAHRCRIRGE